MNLFVSLICQFVDIQSNFGMFSMGSCSGLSYTNFFLRDGDCTFSSLWIEVIVEYFRWKEWLMEIFPFQGRLGLYRRSILVRVALKFCILALYEYNEDLEGKTQVTC